MLFWRWLRPTVACVIFNKRSENESKSRSSVTAGRYNIKMNVSAAHKFDPLNYFLPQDKGVSAMREEALPDL